MNYSESSKILDELNNARKIIVNCHRGPDSDSVGSAMALRLVLLGMDKEVTVVCPSEVPGELDFINGSENIKTIDFDKFDFSLYDLFIAIDSSTWGMVCGEAGKKPPENIKIAVIDHHATNKGYGTINLIDSKTTSTAELLYKVFSDWDVKLNTQIASSLLTGIMGDTGAFQYQGVGKNTLMIAAELIDLGADKDDIVQNLYRNIRFKEVKFWGKVIESMTLEENGNFVWAAIPNSIYKDFGEMPMAKEDAANLFFPIVKESDFGVIMVETKENFLSVSFRSRKDFDVSQIATEIGGGGHKVAAGAKVEGLNYEEAKAKVLEACRKYATKD